jgi:hypothetical protein
VVKDTRNTPATLALQVAAAMVIFYACLQRSDNSTSHPPVLQHGSHPPPVALWWRLAQLARLYVECVPAVA